VKALAWRWRDREWSWIALTAIALCLLFSIWPAVDLRLARWFVDADAGFVGQRLALVQISYHAVPWAGRVLTLLALLLAFWPALRIRRPWRRRLLALALCLLLGVGAAVNGGFKEHWGRARPSAVAELGGAQVFSPALRPVAQCQSNCSFVSGHAASGFALMSVGLLSAPHQRRRWLAIGAVAGLGIGLGRMAQGAHFASDVLFAGLFVWVCLAAVRELWLRAAWLRRRRRVRALSGPPGQLPTARTVQLPTARKGR
jgi:membrane-associated PAP2 superfamily phosphatase